MQQFHSNSPEFKKLNYSELDNNSSVDEPINDHVKLLGMMWDTHSDTLYNKNNEMDPKANTLRFI